MCERARAALALLILAAGAAASPAAADPAPAAAGSVAATSVAAILPLAFRADQIRGPGSEAALAAETSGLLGRKVSGGVALLWGEGGGAVLSLSGEAVAATPVSAEAAEGLAAAETPRDAWPGTRRALSGPVSAYLSGRGSEAGAPTITVRERQPVALGGDPKPVPVSTATVPAGPDAVFTGDEVRAAEIDGGLALLALKARGAATSLAVIGRRDGAWGLRAETPALAGSLGPVAAGNFDGSGRLSLALVRSEAGEGRLQHWRIAEGRAVLAAEAPGYAESGAALDLDGDGTAELAIPTRDRRALAVVSLKGGITERARVALPAPARAGPLVLGSGRKAHVLIGLEDGRVADWRP
ncbi:MULTISPECIES: hypothetical protein [Methylobacterium]|uniref:FG-GAP repeat protein n=1 Tax=Methylobacterium isbiliense TaxID=315478 RepID=A0ABQ4SNS2_9HYPH|nr:MULTISPECIES: hypothetical protein [Methylobacterium]MBY0295322.1 hypothetical protein [Methylobacterium sp.]MDN3624557.1 hypothetical protein [Methylobacterium isbiliense]GJE03470.1 hypothetical protein GMJLKIPL_5425 [Methylobacterium isbiliense]